MFITSFLTFFCLVAYHTTHEVKEIRLRILAKGKFAKRSGAYFPAVLDRVLLFFQQTNTTPKEEKSRAGGSEFSGDFWKK
jgi:hypothetical protein